jgi:hypothetical protein
MENALSQDIISSEGSHEQSLGGSFSGGFCAIAPGLRDTKPAIARGPKLEWSPGPFPHCNSTSLNPIQKPIFTAKAPRTAKTNNSIDL